MIRTVVSALLALLTAFSSFVAAQSSAPISPELKQQFEQLIGKETESRAAAYPVLEKSGNGALVPALEAFRSGLLERRTDGRLVIYLSRVDVNGQSMFPIADAWTLEPLKQTDGSPLYAPGLSSGMLKSDSSNADSLARLIAVLSVHHPDPEKRRNAIIDVANRVDRTLLADLQEQLKTESAGEIATTLRESIARIQLASGSAEERLAAVKVLEELGTSRGLGDLRAALDTAREAANVPLVEAIEGALATVESYQWKVRMVHHTFAGLSLGSILVLLALGLSIIFGLMRVINLAHGEFMMVGAYTAFVVAEFFKAYVPASLFNYYFVLALPLAFLVTGLVGMLCEFAVIRHLYGRPIETLLATWGISLLLIQTARLIFGDTTSLTPPGWLQGGWEVAPDLVLPLNRVFIIVFCAACIVGVYYLVQRTRFGLLLRATTQDRPIAAALGVPTRWIDGLTFGFGAGLAGVAGAIVPLFDKLNPNMGQGYVVDSFMVVVVGGVGKLAGAITAGGALGFLTKYIEPFLEAVYGKLAVLGLIILFLQWRPSGLFPHRGRLAED
ncbi:MAG TPA: urea ABC transporter permease subunit UrtB [Terriglobia bacterium]|nr:urea ABC transporter permease subunit UrtB [Terriglobia bacterium]